MVAVKNISRVLGAAGLFMAIGITGASDAGIIDIHELVVGLLISVLLVLISAAHSKIIAFFITLIGLCRTRNLSIKNFTQTFRQVGYFTT